MNKYFLLFDYYLRTTSIYFFHNIIHFFNLKYPFWFLSLFCNKTYLIPLLILNRNDDIKKKYLLYNQTNKKNIFIENIKNHNEKYVFLKNDFPYNIDDNIKHYVLWCKEKSSINNIENIITIKIRELINKKIFSKQEYEFVFSYNVEKNKSIPEIMHYHVFIK